MKALPFALVLAAAPVTYGVAQAETYTIDPTHTTVLFTVEHFGFANAFGFFREVTGEVVFDPEAPEASSVSVLIPSASVDTNHPHRDGWVTGENMLNVAVNPEITFTSTAIEVTGENTGTLTGDLTISGVTQPVVLDVTFNQLAPNPITETPTVGFSATGTLLRSEFGLSAFVGPIADEVNVMIEVEAVAADS
ncbi:MAG: YceI family protein [Pseudomonadota bacterium]